LSLALDELGTENVWLVLMLRKAVECEGLEMETHLFFSFKSLNQRQLQTILDFIGEFKVQGSNMNLRDSVKDTEHQSLGFIFTQSPFHQGHKRAKTSKFTLTKAQLIHLH
jgi:hypothetical protein